MAARTLLVGTLAIAIAASALAGAVVKRGGSGADTLVGTKRADTLIGQRGRDLLRGKRRRDVLRGGPGGDLLIGGKGRDILRGGRGRDGFGMRNGVQLASPGNDVIRARDGRLDEINCGAGANDKAIVDSAEDGVYDCEVVKEPPPPAP